MKKIIAVLSVLAVIFLALAYTPARAIDDPDTPPSVRQVDVYELANGGLGVLVDYFLDYAVNPTETATEAYLLMFLDADGATQLQTVAPYAFQSSGYGRGLIWFQFTEAEVVSYGLDSSLSANYTIRFTGNPTLAWAGDPPTTDAGIDEWHSTGDPTVVLASQVRYYADQLELAWSLDMIEPTALGNRLTTTGENYFLNVIPDLRTLAPSAFAATTVSPMIPNLDFSTLFGANMTNGTGTVAGSPITFAAGTTTVNVTGAGTFTIVLRQGTAGNMTNLTGVVTGSPVTLYRGTNTVTVTAPGTFTMVFSLVNTDEQAKAENDGTGFDTGSGFAGLSGDFWSGLIWFVMTIVACAVYLGAESKRQPEGYDFGGSRGKGVLIIFDLMIIGGSIMGLLTLLATIVLIIAFGTATGYVFFFRQGGTDKSVMFAIWVWFLVSLGGNIWIGGNPVVATTLTSDITASSTTISVTSTTGFPDTGAIVIDDEVIKYPTKSSTSFQSSFLVNSVLRGQDGTTATTHATGAIVRSKEASYINSSLEYKIATLTDSAGLMAYLAIPFRLIDLILTFFSPSFSYLGSGLEWITYLWAIISIGLLVGLWIQLAGGRRV